MCPGLMPDLERSSSFEGTPAQAFARSFSDEFRRQWFETVQESMQEGMSTESMLALGQQLIQQTATFSTHFRCEYFKQVFLLSFTYFMRTLTLALGGLDILSPHAATPSKSGWMFLRRYYGFMTSMATIFSNIALYASVCGLIILLSLRLNTKANGARNTLTSRHEDQSSQEELMAHLAGIVEIPYVCLLGFLTTVLKNLAILSAYYAILSMLMSFSFPSFTQLLFWIAVYSLVYYWSNAITRTK